MTLSNYKHQPFSFKLNWSKIPITLIPSTDEGMAEFNEILEEVERLHLRPSLVRTKSGGISIAVKHHNQFPGYDLRQSNSCFELTVICELGMFRFQFRNNFKSDTKSSGISGHQAFLRFKEVCGRFGVKLEDLRNTDQEAAAAVKETIEKPHIDLTFGFENVVFPDHVHHIDVHSSHMAGVAFAFPVLLDPIRYCYEHRKEDETFKAVLTHSWGYFQSAYSPVYYGYSHLSKAGMDYTNRTVEDLTERLRAAGRVIIAHNTDGIWYYGDIYHGEGEGSALGEWSNDYHDCRFRAKSKGVYEFEGYDKHDQFGYKAVARGRFELDKVKPRDTWTWGDIYYTGKAEGFYIDEATNRIRKGELPDG